MSKLIVTEAHVDRILSLADGGMPPRVIFEQLGQTIELSSIYHVISRARKRGAKIPHFPTTPGPRTDLRFTLDPGDQASLITEAKRRRVSPSQLAQRLVEAVIAGNIFDAVLDDHPEAA